MQPAVAIDPAFCADAFSLTPDPSRLFLSRDHAEALAGLRVGLEGRRGLIVVVGEVGMGKTTVAYSLLSSLGDEVRTAYIANTRVPFDGLLRHALDDFGVQGVENDRASLLSALSRFLLQCAAQGQMAVLVVDEAQSLDDETFENLRLLSNVETYQQKLLQIVLLGQPELDAKLRQTHLRQIAERVGVRVNINPLDETEGRRYIEHRLARSGGSLDMFSPAALRTILRRAEGVPRRINILCHNALLLAYAAGADQVSAGMAREAAKELAGGSLVRFGRRPSSVVARATRRWRTLWGVPAGIALVACAKDVAGVFLGGGC
jgi:general secretion pathway protein A